MYSIKKLNWDSNFFNKTIGEISNIKKKSIIKNDDLLSYNLIIHKENRDISIHIDGFENKYKEVKFLFSKKTKYAPTYNNTTIICDYDDKKIDNEAFYNLAYESGKFSRFKLDTNFNNLDFYNLYNKWVDNSLNKSFADKVFYIEDNKIVIGFMTIKMQINTASIGLIAISKNHQGKGLGSLLINKAEHYCKSNKIEILEIPTQKKNLIACNFYSKLEYKLTQQTYINHFWNLNNDPF